MSAASAVPPGAVAGDEEAWLYESKDTDAPPPGDDSSQEPGVPGEDSQEEQEVTVVEESGQGDKDSVEKRNKVGGKDDLEEGEDQDEDEEDDDDEDEIEITIGDTKSAPAPAGAPAAGTAGGVPGSGAPVNLNIKKSIGATVVPTIGVPGGQIVKQTHKGLDIDATASINGTNIYEFNIDSLEEKPWRKPGADITDYFNYGFTEDTWKIYCDRQRRLRGDNNIQGVKSMVNQVPSTLGNTGGGYEKYRPSFGGSRESKESYASGPRGGMSAKRESGGTIDVIGANSNSRRPLQGPPPPLEDSGPPPPMMGGPPSDMPPHFPGQFANVGHPMPPYDPHTMPPPPFDPRFPPPGGMMPSPMDAGGMAPAPYDPYGAPMGMPPPPMPNMPPPPMPGPGDFRLSAASGGGPVGVVEDSGSRMGNMPSPLDDLAEFERRRHHRAREEREEREYREDRERRHRERERERDSRDDRRDREDRRERDRGGDRERDRSERDRGERDRESDRHRSSRKSRRHEEEEDDRRSKHKRSKRDDDP